MNEQTRALAPENRPQTIDPIKKLNEPIRVFMDPSISYEAKPVTSWAEIDRWEKKWQVKKGPGKNESVSLPTYIQENAQKIFDIGWEQGFIKADDIKNIRKVIETNDVDKDGKRRTYEEDPFQFLNTHLDADPKKPPEFPKTLTEQQQVDLISFIYSKITADPKVEDSSQPDGFKHFGNRFLNEVIKKFGPEVNKYNPKHGPNFSDQSQWLIGFNIATRKAIDTMMSAQSYTPTERVMQKLEQRMVIAGGVSQKEPGVFKATGSMKPTNETTGRSEASFDKDMLMRRTLEVAIPPEAMAQMTRDEFQSTRKDISYLERGEAKMRLEKQRELWSLATLDYFGFRREMPGLQSLANEREKHLTRPELEMIDAYKDRVGKRVSELGGLSGEFGAMNPLEANLKKTEGLVVALVDDKKLTKQAEERFHRENKQRKTIRPEELVAMKAKIKNELSEKVESLLKKPRVIQERVTNPQADPDDQKTEFRYQYTIDEMVKESGITDGFEGEEKTHIMKALVDGLKNRESIEPLYKSPENYNGELNHGLMKRLDDKEGGAHKVEDYIINTNLALGLKGLEFVNRNLASKVIKEEKRYPGFTITRGSKGEVHLNSLLSKATKGEGEGGMVQVKNVQSAESTTQPTKEEVDAKEAQKEKDSQAVELAKLLGFKEPIANEAEFRDSMLSSGILVSVDNQEGEGQHYEMNIEMLNLTSVDQLNTLSHLSEFYTNMPILVESLNLTINEAGGPEAISTIQNFNIESLILSGPTSEGSETNIALLGGSCDYVEIRQGQFNISTNTSPIRVAMTEGDQAKASKMIFTENSLVQTLSRNEDIRTEFLMGENALIQIEIQGDGPQGENRVVYEGEPHNVSKGNTGKFILINENGVYKLVNSEYKFAAETIESSENLLGAHSPKKTEPVGEVNELGLAILHEKMRNDVLLDADDRAVAIDMMTRGLGNRTATVSNIDYALKLYDDAVAQGVTIPAEITEVVQRVRVLESVRQKKVVQAEVPATELINAVLKIEYPEPPSPNPEPTEGPTQPPAPAQQKSADDSADWLKGIQGRAKNDDLPEPIPIKQGGSADLTDLTDLTDSTNSTASAEPAQPVTSVEDFLDIPVFLRNRKFQPSTPTPAQVAYTDGSTERSRIKLKNVGDQIPSDSTEHFGALIDDFKGSKDSAPATSTEYDYSNIKVETKENEGELKKQRELIFNKPVITADGKKGIYRGYHYAGLGEKFEDGIYDDAPSGLYGVIAHNVEINGRRYNYLHLPNAEPTGESGVEPAQPAELMLSNMAEDGSARRPGESVIAYLRRTQPKLDEVEVSDHRLPITNQPVAPTPITPTPAPAQSTYSVEDTQPTRAVSRDEPPLEFPSDIPVPPVKKRRSLGEMWDNRPDWFFRGKEKVDEETAGGAGSRGQALENSNPANDPTSATQSTIPVNASQTDDTLFETPVNIPEPEKTEQASAPKEAPAADNETPDWLKAAAPGKKIASADGTPEADDDSELPDFLRNRR